MWHLTSVSVTSVPCICVFLPRQTDDATCSGQPTASQICETLPPTTEVYPNSLIMLGDIQYTSRTRKITNIIFNLSLISFLLIHCVHTRWWINQELAHVTQWHKLHQCVSYSSKEASICGKYSNWHSSQSKDRKCATENVGHNMHTDHFVWSPNFNDDLHINKTNCPGTVKTNLKGMPMDFGNTVTLKWGEINTRFRGDLTAMVWKDKM